MLVLQTVFSLGWRSPELGVPCVFVCSLPRHARHDPAPGRRRPAESDSELSVSGFLSVASYSCEEDEGKDASLLHRHSALGGPSGMSGEGDHGNQAAQHNGVEAHRWGRAPDAMLVLFGAGDETLECFAGVFQPEHVSKRGARKLATGMSDNFLSSYLFILCNSNSSKRWLFRNANLRS